MASSTDEFLHLATTLRGGTTFARRNLALTLRPRFAAFFFIFATAYRER